jgi:Rrf2 family protein
MISQTAEYALRAIVYLADQKGAARTNTQIAKATQVPAGYLAKVLQSLARARLVRSQRGLNGGFTLLEPAERLTVLEVISAVDPLRRFPTCPLKLPAHAQSLCPLHRRLDEAADVVQRMLSEVTIADLLHVPVEERPLCRFPCPPRRRKPPVSPTKAAGGKPPSD